MPLPTSAPDAPVTRRPRRPAVVFALHYLEMVVAMLVGMVVLDKVWALVWPALTARTDVLAMVMATDMAIGMAAWMRFRRSSWRHITEMCAAMYLPFVVLLAPFWMGLISGGVLLTAGHLLMLPAMAVPMLRHRGHA
jgi:flagellar biosynthetic protein FliP